jgi:predicted ATPase
MAGGSDIDARSKWSYPDALTAQIEALAQQTPVLMVFEDVHWIDPTSLEVLGRGVSRNNAVCVLLIITYRPGPAANTNHSPRPLPRYVKGRRVTVKTATRKNFTIHVGK